MLKKNKENPSSNGYVSQPILLLVSTWEIAQHFSGPIHWMFFRRCGGNNENRRFCAGFEDVGPEARTERGGSGNSSPIGSVGYGIFTYIWHKSMVFMQANIPFFHGSYGSGFQPFWLRGTSKPFPKKKIHKMQMTFTHWKTLEDQRLDHNDASSSARIRSDALNLLRQSWTMICWRFKIYYTLKMNGWFTYFPGGLVQIIFLSFHGWFSCRWTRR